MGKPTDKDIVAWLAAAGKSSASSKSIVQLVVDTAQFIQNTLKYNPVSCLPGIDLSKPIKKISSLPDGIYLQWKDEKRGKWFTHTGISGDEVGISILGRKRKLYRPGGSVAALRSKAKSVKDTWTVSRLFQLIDSDDERVRKLIDKIDKRLAAEKKGLNSKELAERYKRIVQKVLGRLGQMTKGGGTQYLVANSGSMKTA